MIDSLVRTPYYNGSSRIQGSGTPTIVLELAPVVIVQVDTDQAIDPEGPARSLSVDGFTLSSSFSRPSKIHSPILLLHALLVPLGVECKLRRHEVWISLWRISPYRVHP